MKLNEILECIGEDKHVDQIGTFDKDRTFLSEATGRKKNFTIDANTIRNPIMTEYIGYANEGEKKQGFTGKDSTVNANGLNWDAMGGDKLDGLTDAVLEGLGMMGGGTSFIEKHAELKGGEVRQQAKEYLEGAFRDVMLREKERVAKGNKRPIKADLNKLQNDLENILINASKDQIGSAETKAIQGGYNPPENMKPLNIKPIVQKGIVNLKSKPTLAKFFANRILNTIIRKYSGGSDMISQVPQATKDDAKTGKRKAGKHWGKDDYISDGGYDDFSTDVSGFSPDDVYGMQ